MGWDVNFISTEAAGKPHSKSSLVDDKSLLEWDQDARCYSLLNMRDVTRQQEASKTKGCYKIILPSKFFTSSNFIFTIKKKKKGEHSSLMILSWRFSPWSEKRIRESWGGWRTGWWEERSHAKRSLHENREQEKDSLVSFNSLHANFHHNHGRHPRDSFLPSFCLDMNLWSKGIRF